MRVSGLDRLASAAANSDSCYSLAFLQVTVNKNDANCTWNDVNLLFQNICPHKESAPTGRER